MGKSKVLRKKMKYLKEEQEDNTNLLPKLPNDITVQHICTKLPWRAFHVLSSVSRAWRGAIQSGEIHDTRVRSGAAETLAFLECTFPDEHARPCDMALYSLRDKAIYRLPSPPAWEGRDSPSFGLCITIGGKVYSLGKWGAKMWVFDVAGQKKWQQCARVHIERMDFECAAFDGKIYVFGGYTLRRSPFPLQQPIDFSEVYDPKVDAWTKIRPMKFWKNHYMVWAGALRDEILVDGGEFYHRDYCSGSERDWRPSERSIDGMEAYNPAKDSWRTIPPGDFGEDELQLVGSEKRERLFTAHGRLHSLSRGKISVIDLDQKSVKGLHKCSFKTRSRDKHPRGSFWPDQVLVTNEGLLTKGHFDCCLRPHNKCRLFQSGTIELGFGKKKIVLEEVEFSPSVRFFSFSCLQPIQL